MAACFPERATVNEPVGNDSPVLKLPGSNPFWSAEDGKETDSNPKQKGSVADSQQ
jgi:hypothetical protein